MIIGRYLGLGCNAQGVYYLLKLQGMNHAHPFLYEQSQQEITPIIDCIEVDSLYESFEVQALRVRTEQAQLKGSPVFARSEVPSNQESIFKVTPGHSKRSGEYSNGRLNNRLMNILNSWGEKQQLADRVRDLQLRFQGLKTVTTPAARLGGSKQLLHNGRLVHDSIKEKLSKRSILKKQSLNLLTNIYNKLQLQSADWKIGNTKAE